MRDIFAKRRAFKPFEYMEVVPFKKAINQSYWLVDEWNFMSDVQDFHVRLNPVEQAVIRNTLLAISQIEVSVKEFWAEIGNRFPKPEIKQVGATFAESEVRHADAYSHLLEVLHLNKAFDTIMEVPAIQGRVDYLTKYLAGAAHSSQENYTLQLALFSLFVENVSLFAQFCIIKSFNKHLNVLKDIDNVVQATQKEETVHALFGTKLLEIIRDEHPEWFNEAFFAMIRRAALKAYDSEIQILEWIFEEGEPEFITKTGLREFIKSRFNESLRMIGAEPAFDVDDSLLREYRWFIEEIHADVSPDFFHKRPVTYSKSVQSITPDDLF